MKLATKAVRLVRLEREFEHGMDNLVGRIVCISSKSINRYSIAPGPEIMRFDGYLFILTGADKCSRDVTGKTSF